MKFRRVPIFAALACSAHVASARGATGPVGDGVAKVGGVKSSLDRLAMPPRQPTSPEFIMSPANDPPLEIDWPIEGAPKRCAKGRAGLLSAQSEGLS